MNDAKALARLQAGEPQALDDFIEKYGNYVGAVVNSVLQGCMSREDVELLPLNLKGYLSRVARSLALRKLRERTRELPLDEDVLSLEEDSIIEKLDQEERDRRVREAVLSMTQPDQEIFLRHYYYCQSVSVIAEKMNMNPSTIKTRLRRGREKLRQHLTGLEP